MTTTEQNLRQIIREELERALKPKEIQCASSQRNSPDSIPPSFLQCMADKWPSGIVAREDIDKFSGGILNPGTMRYKDKGLTRLKIGRKVAYRVQDLIEWLCERGHVVEPDKSLEELIQEKINGKKRRSK